MTGRAGGGRAGRGGAHLPGVPRGWRWEGPGGSSAPGGRGGGRSGGFDSSRAGWVPSSPPRWEGTRRFNFARPGLIPRAPCHRAGGSGGKLPSAVGLLRAAAGTGAPRRAGQ